MMSFSFLDDQASRQKFLLRFFIVCKIIFSNQLLLFSADALKTKKSPATATKIMETNIKMVIKNYFSFLTYKDIEKSNFYRL